MTRKGWEVACWCTAAVGLIPLYVGLLYLGINRQMHMDDPYALMSLLVMTVLLGCMAFGLLWIVSRLLFSIAEKRSR